MPPERRHQLWRDIDDFGLPDDGYDYTMHLRNPGAGVRLDANFSDDVVRFLEKKEDLERAQADKHTREVLSKLEASDDDEEAPALETDAPRPVPEPADHRAVRGDPALPNEAVAPLPVRRTTRGVIGRRLASAPAKALKMAV